ncbi:MAG: S8 family serine peptidase [Saprospiraceae bacterium]|nr:S8 family serine peptidase [Saprospiraceae bacterium]
MKTIYPLLIILISCSISLSAQDSEPTPIPGRYIVMLKESAATPVALNETVGIDRTSTYEQNQLKRSTNLNKLVQLRQANGVPENKVVAEYADALVGFTADLTPAEVAKLSASPDVENVTQDYTIQMDAQVDEGAPEGYAIAGQTVTCAIQNAGGFKVYDGSGDKWLWILDTGIDLDHPDLAVNDLFPYPKSFVPGETYDDGHGHGTHVAGIAAARNNNFGVVGVSAGALVIPIKVLSNAGVATMTSVLQGLNHVALYDKFGDVVNLSLGTYPVTNCANSNPPLRTAILNMGTSGTWVCMASGNNSGKAINCNPGCINGTRVVTVSAMTCAGSCAQFPNWGTSVVDWVATGVNVYSTYKNGKYATFSGTSQATPVVAGIIHSTGQAPVSGGTVNCGNLQVPPALYKKARRQ